MHRNWPGTRSLSVNEPCDTGADESIFERVRRGQAIPRAPKAEDLPFATERFVTGSWAPALAATGVPHRDEAYGFVYVTR